MKYDHEKHHRRSIRLPGYDYSAPGAYFVTVCVQGRRQLFGTIEDGQMHLNEAGQMIRRVWLEMPGHYPGVELDIFTVMPNHFHGIIFLNIDVGAPLVGALCVDTQTRNRAGTRPAPTLGDVTGAFKSITTNEYIHGVQGRGWPRFQKRLWQRNYYERVIRDEDEINQARNYIHENPLMWRLDRENPDAIGMLPEGVAWEA